LLNTDFDYQVNEIGVDLFFGLEFRQMSDDFLEVLLFGVKNQCLQQALVAEIGKRNLLLCKNVTV